MIRNSTNQLSERDADLTHTKAAKAEFTKDYDQAFRLYIQSAQAFLHLSRSGAITEKKKEQLKANAAKSVERAELIKKFVDASRQAITSTTSAQSAAPSLSLTPVAIDIFSPQEQSYVLQKGGHVNGLWFPLWDDPISVNYQSGLFIDPDGQPRLSPEQEKDSAVWRRPINSESQFYAPAHPKRRIVPQEVLQYTVTDCSVCASISVCLEHGRRFGSSLAEGAVHDSLESKSLNLVQGRQRGRCDVRIFFNGEWRRIVIDDQLPFHPHDGRLMCMTILTSTSGGSRITTDTLWPSLIEKAYMKLMGGYDFMGSNSSIDLHAFIGWIPEHIDIKWSHFEREKTWERIKEGFSSGRCLITLGTGVNHEIYWRDVLLLHSHSYAVIDVRESPEDRILTILDSWVRPNEEKRNTSHSLEIPWSEILSTFDSVYLSWDPSPWSQPLSLHGIWRRTEDPENRVNHLQAEFRNDGVVEDEILVLLTRHVVNTKRTNDFVALQVEVEDHLILASDFQANQSLSSRGAYTNSTQVLNRVRIHAPQKSGILRISVSYEGDASEMGYTLSLYSVNIMRLSWIERQTNPPYSQKVEGTFTSKNGGGNCSYPSFMINPQYRLVVHSTGPSSGKVNVTLTLRSGKDLPVNVAMVWSKGQRLSELSEKDLAATSGAYTYGLARVTKAISPGEYTLVVSAFEPHYMGPFSLRIESSHLFDVVPILQEGAGMYSRVIRGSWNGQSAVGAPSFNRYTKNPVFSLGVPADTQLKIRLQLLQPSAAVALNVTVYSDLRGDVGTSLSQKSHVLTSGPYDDNIAGVATPQATLHTGRYYIVPSTYNFGHEAGFKLIIYSSISGIVVSPMGSLGD